MKEIQGEFGVKKLKNKIMNPSQEGKSRTPHHERNSRRVRGKETEKQNHEPLTLKKISQESSG